MDAIVKDAMQIDRMKRLALADKIEGPLPQLVINVDTSEKADEYSLRVSMDERRLLITALRRP